MSNFIATCSCGDGSSIENYGLPGCLNGVTVPEDVYFMSLDKVDGSSNGIDLVTDTLNQVFFDLRFKAQEVRERWLVIKNIEDFISTPPDANKFTFPSGTEIKLSEGIRLVTMTFPIDDPNKFKKKIDALSCRRRLGVMYKDRNKSLVGQTVPGTDNFIAREIIDGSIDAKVFDKTDTEAARVELSFQYARVAKDGNVDFIQESSMGGFNLNLVKALIDANITITASLLASIAFTVEDDYNGALDRTPVGGLSDAPSLDVFNNTDVAIETLSSFDEPTAGNYVATYTTPVTAADLMEVRGIGADYVQLDSDLKRFIGVELAAS